MRRLARPEQRRPGGFATQPARHRQVARIGERHRELREIHDERRSQQVAQPLGAHVQLPVPEGPVFGLQPHAARAVAHRVRAGVDHQTPTPRVHRRFDPAGRAQAVADLGELQELGERKEDFGPQPERRDGATGDVPEAQLHEDWLRRIGPGRPLGSRHGAAGHREPQGDLRRAQNRYHLYYR